MLTVRLVEELLDGVPAPVTVPAPPDAGRPFDPKPGSAGGDAEGIEFGRLGCLGEGDEGRDGLSGRGEGRIGLDGREGGGPGFDGDLFPGLFPALFPIFSPGFGGLSLCGLDGNLVTTSGIFSSGKDFNPANLADLKP
jgi:hypothetical protein